MISKKSNLTIRVKGYARLILENLQHTLWILKNC